MKDFCVEFLTRPGCELCSEAESTVERAVQLVGGRLVCIDIDADPELAVDFVLRIPVVRTSSGVVLDEGIIGFGKLWRRLVWARLRGM